LAEVTPEQILSITPQEPPAPKKLSVGWTIFWLIVATPVGWYLVVKKTDWPSWIKLVVIIFSAVVFLALAIETELVANQIVSQFDSSLDPNSLLQ
jgi:hypothetical protein